MDLNEMYSVFRSPYFIDSSGDKRIVVEPNTTDLFWAFTHNKVYNNQQYAYVCKWT